MDLSIKSVVVDRSPAYYTKQRSAVAPFKELSPLPATKGGARSGLLFQSIFGHNHLFRKDGKHGFPRTSIGLQDVTGVVPDCKGVVDTRISSDLPRGTGGVESAF